MTKVGLGALGTMLQSLNEVGDGYKELNEHGKDLEGLVDNVGHHGELGEELEGASDAWEAAPIPASAQAGPKHSL